MNRIISFQLARPAFVLVGHPLTKFCLNQSGTASKRKNLQTERFWLLLTSPRLSTRSGTLLCFHKLLSLKLPPCFVLWVRSFLSDRRAKVQVGGSHSRSFGIRRGVPQGSVLGSVLFILFVDDITKDLLRGAHASLYADNLAIWSSSPDPLKASCVVQSSLAVLETWSNLWRLPLNPKKCESSFFFSTDPHQATFEPRLNLLGFPLLFNPTPKFLGVTFDRTLSFGAHVQFLCSKFYPRHKALRSIATASWGPTKESLSLLYKAFVRSVLTYASPGWFPFFCNTATNHLEVLHRAACRVITGCLFSTPSSLLLLEAQLPPLKLTLEHQTLYSFERALRLPPDFSSLYALAIKKRSLSTIEETLLLIILFFSHTTTPIPTRVSDYVPPFSPMVHNPLQCFPLHSRLLRQQYISTPNCFKRTILPPPV